MTSRVVDIPYYAPYILLVKATMTSKGQITIPAPIRERLKLTAGTVLNFEVHGSFFKATRVVDIEAMRSVIGIAKNELAHKSTAQWLEELRGPADLPSSTRG